jgi:hypothetical protein
MIFLFFFLIDTENANNLSEIMRQIRTQTDLDIKPIVYTSRYQSICLLPPNDNSWLSADRILSATVKSGNFVTFFAQNIFFHKIM